MSDQEYNHAVMERGSDAVIAEGVVRPIIGELRENKVVRLISMYRSHDTDHDLLVGAIAELSVLDDLMHELESRQRQAHIAMQKEFANAKT